MEKIAVIHKGYKYHKVRLNKMHKVKWVSLNKLTYYIYIDYAIFGWK